MAFEKLYSSSLLFAFVSVTICRFLVSLPTAYANVGNVTDREALLQIKAKITDDPFGILSSWNDSVHFCEWHGVTCGRSHQRVTVLVLASKELGGSISPHIGNLSFLRELHLPHNSFKGEIPLEISHLLRLRVLWLRNNSLSGEIPANISRCSNLIYVSFEKNRLVGKIPAEFGSFSKLGFLSFFQNKLTGSIPPSLGNLSSLDSLELTFNGLVGNIPDSLGQLRLLTVLDIAINHLSGEVPISIFNLSSLEALDIASNRLKGNLPSSMFISLPNLTFFSIAANQFTGSVPPSLPNASNMVTLQIEGNKLEGQVPNLQRLNGLQSFLFGWNNLGSGGGNDMDFLCSLTNTSTIEELDIGSNKFGGMIPKCIGNLTSNLTTLFIENNQIFGSIPIDVGSLLNLADFWASNNNLSGIIPQTIGNLENLVELHLNENKFSGPIPSSLGNLTKLSTLNLSDNHLEGVIPLSLGECKNLQVLDLSRNNLNGSIPAQVIGLSSLSIYLGFSHNYLTGPIPREIGKLVNLGRLEIDDNLLSGEIPRELGSCKSLEYLHMDRNHLNGPIPSSLSSLRALRALDLSNNSLSGQIPEFLAGFNLLIHLNLSFNELEGMVPSEGVFKNTSATSVMGNKNLCGGIPELQLPVCNIEKNNSKRLSTKVKAIIATIPGTLGVILVFFFIFLPRLREKKEKLNSCGSGYLIPKVSYNDLREATNGFSPANLLGVGSFGSVYKGIVRESGKLIAVKVINLQYQGAMRSFEKECEALRNVRHRNLVKILTACSSIDHQGNDFKALVYELIVNGSLEEWLHPTSDDDDATYQVRKNLTVLERLNIAIDVAFALEYLHGQCDPAIVHCDIKPSNVLLDDRMIAHVSDFGLAKLLSKSNEIPSASDSSSIALRGTIGYTPPEYGLGSEISICGDGDVYGYGIMLLEIITGKKPTNDMFKEGLNLHKLAQRYLSDGMTGVIDPILLEEVGTMETRKDTAFDWKTMGDNRVIECLMSVLKIGVACSAELPRDRMYITEVTRKLCSIRDKLLRRGYVTW